LTTRCFKWIIKGINQKECNFERVDRMLELEEFKLEIEARKGDLDEMRASL